MSRSWDNSRALPLLALVVACGTSPTSSQPGESVPDARGCSDWPSRPGERFISVDGASGFEVEPFLIAKGGDLAIAWEASGCDALTRIGYTRRGPSASFAPIRYLASPNGQMASNITLAFDDAGTLFVAWASWTPGPDRAQPHAGVSDIHIQLARWPAGGTAFDAPVELSEPIADALYDKPWMLITADGSVVVSYSDLRRGGIWVAASVDGGATFQRTLVDSTWANLAASCPDGRPGGAFLTYFTSHIIRVAHTTDGGRTWSAPLYAAASDATANVACQDPTCVADGDDVWVSYGRTHDGYDTPVERLATVQVAHVTLGQPMVTSDIVALAAPAATAALDGGAPPGFLLFPQLARLRDGTFALAAYRAAAEASGAADLVYVRSTDGGLAFGAPTLLATGLTASVQRHVPDWLGDYFGWGLTTTGMGAAFVDNASGFSHIVLDQTVIPSAGP